MHGEYRAIWTVPGGGTGYSVLHFDQPGDQAEADLVAARIRTLFFSMQSLFPDDITIAFDSEILILDDAGVLQSVFAVTPPTTVTGTSTAVYSRAAGARIDWATGVIVGGRRLTGRTYLVPMVSTIFTTAGLLTPTAVTTIQTAASGYISSMTTDGVVPRVWSRVHQTTAVVISASAPTNGAILRSRRD